MPRPASAARSIVLTGLGPISAFGVGIDPLWAAMCEGRSAIAPIKRWDASGFPSCAGAELADELYDVKTAVPKSYRKATKVMARDIELAVGAAAEAIRSAGLVTRGTAEGATPTIVPDRMGCHIGAGLIAAELDELTGAMWASRRDDPATPGDLGVDLGHWGNQGMENLTPLWLLKYLPNMLACHVTIIHDCQGPSNTITCADASALLSLGESRRVIERGDADACLSGGAESRINHMGMLRQTFAGRVAPAPAGVDPATVVKPFAPDAKGSAIGEGGGIVVLEAEETATARGARKLARLIGFGASQCFPHDPFAADLSGCGDDIAEAIRVALDDAGVSASDLHAIVPTGTGIPGVDAGEAAAIRQIFESRAATIPIVQVTPFVGLCGAGSGALSVAIATRCLLEQRLPARINTAGCTWLDANAAPARAAKLDRILVLSTSLGGQVAAAVLERTGSGTGA
jgi:3-oxoacyl-[acyl-carrier-protein] synthase II